MALRSPNIFLRHPRPDDFAQLEQLHAASRNHLRGFASTHFDRAKFDRMLIDAAMESNEYFLICRREDDAIVGSVNLSQIFRKAFQNAYLGCQLYSRFTGKGYMTEAVHNVLSLAFNELGLHRIEANVQPSNLPSIKVLVRNGFTKEGYSRRYLKIGGRWRDHERWAIIKENWKKH